VHAELLAFLLLHVTRRAGIRFLRFHYICASMSLL